MRQRIATLLLALGAAALLSACGGGVDVEVSGGGGGGGGTPANSDPVSYTHLTLPTNREV